MNPNLSTNYEAFKREHQLRIAGSRRGYLADQAAAARGRHHVAKAIGQRVGIVLVAMGERLQGIQRERVAEPIALQPDGQV